MDNPETSVTLVTHNTQNEDKQNKNKHTTLKQNKQHVSHHIYFVGVNRKVGCACASCSNGPDSVCACVCASEAF